MRGFQNRLSNAIVLLLAGIVFICAAAILPPLWDAVQHVAQSAPAYSLQQCMEIPHGSRRLDCFENFANRPPPQPAKGANAPAGLFRE